MTTAMEQARAVADAVLYEGYLLYPYRASAAKNKVRWQWGVLAPPSFAEAGHGEYASSQAELIAEPTADAVLHVRLRFLHLQPRAVQVPEDDGYRAVPALTVAGTEYTAWEEAVEREVEGVFPFGVLLGDDAVLPIEIGAEEHREPIPGGNGARLVRTCRPLHGELRVHIDELCGPFGGVRLRVSVHNTSAWAKTGAVRPDALPHSLLAAHTLLSLTGGSFLSLLDPPEWASVATRECHNERVWPILVGAQGQRDTVLCSPIILYDYPSIAEQSAGNLFDGTEIDEILTLRTMTLTEQEKREARATDPKAAELIDRVDNLPPELLDRLHGTVRYLRSVTGEGRTPQADELPDSTEAPQTPWWDPGADAAMSPETDGVVISGIRVAKGSRVRLRPAKRADAHDMFLTGRTAVVQAVLLDVDGDWHLAVTLADDEGADLYAAHGRYRYFGTDEVEPLDEIERQR